MQMRLRFFDFFPGLLNRVVVRRVTGQLKGSQTVGERGKESLRRFARVVRLLNYRLD
jgi:hypothetical protein